MFVWSLYRRMAGYLSPYTFILTEYLVLNINEETSFLFKKFVSKTAASWPSATLN
jgi:hypothetical protein